MIHDRGAGVVQIHDQVARGLGYPRGGRVGGDAQDPDASVGMLNYGADVQPGPGQGEGFR
jgi:hypothetical protein